MHDVDLQCRIQPSRRKVMRSPDARCADRKLPRIGPAEGNHVLEIVERDRRVREQHERRLGDHRDRREIGGHVERCGFVEPLRQDSAGLHEQQRVPVGCGLRDEAGADDGARTGSIFDHDRLLQLLLKLLGNDARRGVDRAARRDRHDQRDRTIGISLRRRAVCQDGKRGCASCDEKELAT